MDFRDLIGTTYCAKAPRNFYYHKAFDGWKGVDYTEETVNGKRHYTIDGVRYPSITTVLAADTKKKAVLDRWKARVGEEQASLISGAATRRGSSLHALCETYLTQSQVSIQSGHADKENFLKVKNVLDKHVGPIYCMEEPLVSKKLGIAGRTDLIADWRTWDCPFDVPTVVDFKTSTKTKYEHYIHNYFTQACGYAVMFEEMTGVTVPQIAIIIATEELNEPQLFVEKTDRWMQSLHDAINVYRESNPHDQETRS